jgi:hypothetical protein
MPLRNWLADWHGPLHIADMQETPAKAAADRCSRPPMWEPNPSLQQKYIELSANSHIMRLSAHT